LFCCVALQLSFCGVVYPCLVVTYIGQTAYLRANPGAYTNPFWLALPDGAFWPMMVVATATSIVASQALIR
jgi:KUP system potassium uptake protein